MRLSIIIPAYNAEKYIGDMIKSIDRQSYHGQIEIVIAYDTKSTDNTLGVLYSCIGNSRHIIKIDKARDSSIGAARNRGYQLATGDLILFADADDCLAQNCVSNIIYAFNDNPSLDVVTYKWKITKEHNYKDYLMKYSRDKVCKSIEIVDNVTVMHGFWTSRKYTICAWGYAFRKEFLDKHKITFPDYSSGEDQIFILNAIVNTPRVGRIPAVNYVYVIHDSSVSHKFRSAVKFWSDHEGYRHDYFNTIGDKYPSVESVAYVDYFRWFVYESTRLPYDEYLAVINQYGIRTMPIVVGASLSHTGACILFNISPRLYYQVGHIYRKLRSY